MLVWLLTATVVFLVWRFTVRGRQRGFFRVFFDLMLTMLALGLIWRTVEWFTYR